MREGDLLSRRRTICFVTAVAESFHAHRVMEGVFGQCEKYGYNAAVFSSMVSLDFYFKDYAKAERNIYELIDFSRFDGVILDNISLIYSGNTELVESFCDKLRAHPDIPAVSIAMPFGDIPCIASDNKEMIREICRHVIEVHGCRDLCLLTGMKGNFEAEDRLAVMLDEIKKHGLTVTDEHIIYGDFWYTSGNKLAEDIAAGRIAKPEAVIAASDHMALGLVETLTKLGIKVPDDIRVIGFEATREAALDDISVTSIESNFAKSGADAVDHIRRIIEPDKEILPRSTDLKKMLHLGMSCGCPPDVKRTMDCVKSSLYFTARNYTSDTFNDNIDIGLLMENYIPEQLTSSQSAEECIENIFMSTFIISPFMNFWLCLREDWLDSEADIVRGYPGKMKTVLAKSNTGAPEFCREANSVVFDTSEMLPQMFSAGTEPSAFYFSAVHFGSNTLGYAVLQRKFEDVRKYNLVYRNWLRFINNALEMIRSKKHLAMLSLCDNMTGLLNRRGMYAEFDKMLRNAAEGDMIFACVIDMDGLKFINDSYGHHEGDFGIITVSRAAQQITGAGEICIRSGGDEFFVIGAGKYTDEICRDKVDRFRKTLSEMSEKAGKPYPITASIGCAFRTLESEDDLDDALVKADEEMYHYKVTKKRNRQ